MKRTRKRVSVRPGSVLKAALLLLLGAAALDASGIALADDPPGVSPPSPGPVTSEANDPPHVPNTLYGEEGAIPLEAQSPGDQAGTQAAIERSTYAPSVHEAYSAFAHRAAEVAAVQVAAHQSGTSGLGDVGVGP